MIFHLSFNLNIYLYVFVKVCIHEINKSIDLIQYIHRKCSDSRLLGRFHLILEFNSQK